ncbi:MULTISPECIES: hypothetical protein [unclassified Oleiphilus]|jgi:hypothetical protein|uniref:hypothetical protein n=1 Tax=unclassified Oleiphilus TaxID=2631174 RepID=UPI0007C27CFE|nr:MULTISPECIES: hypothetical protein [unclassified Oleiphilus]KZY46065.1 hypothetical protein A3732_08200 [Oleiphilus sp. HI0050]KZY76404.1 hypothetical protein A3741_10955 [Oleiphilus sp. HI0069]KZY84119.1 hypothetical protein A3740_04745 [Oleiphilus sp. HI0068]KZY89689.1 hypothetical protein A3743_07850 [Oleiphilus sp. HI0072]KZZ10088.1 hypothetical protein A3749_12000 [Oleiphilus sp. HI0078]KZZ27295.1 hypothetical protein A3752_22945 [Oleiphilus sp. HI0081]KZZ32709.1 hypothetical protein
MFQIPNYAISETLFSSVGTRVFRAQNAATGEGVILRACGENCDIESQRARMAFSYEVLQMFDHPNIVKAMELIDDSLSPCMVMEDIRAWT